MGLTLVRSLTKDHDFGQFENFGPSFAEIEMSARFGPIFEHTYKYRLCDDFCFRGDRGLVRSFFRVGCSMGFLDWNFPVKSLCSSAVFGGRPQHPSPCPIRSAPRRERRWMEAGRDEREVREILHFEQYSPVIVRMLTYGEVDKIKFGKTLFPH